MQPALLYALLVLLSQGDACVGPEGELCRGWTYGMDSHVGAFQCPQWRDGVDDKFCCGSCSLPYCCSSGEARLDQQQCPRMGRQQASTSTSGPPPQASTTKGPTPRPTAMKTQDIWFAGLAVSLLFGGGILYALIRYYEQRGRRLPRCLRFRNRGQEGIELEDFPPPTLAHILDPPPPYSEDLPPPYSVEDPRPFHAEPEPTSRNEDPVPYGGEPAPPYSTEDPWPHSVEEPAENWDLPPPSPAVHFRRANVGNPEDEVIARLLAQRNVPSHVLDPPPETSL